MFELKIVAIIVVYGTRISLPYTASPFPTLAACMTAAEPASTEILARAQALASKFHVHVQVDLDGGCKRIESGMRI
jgi:hypothetical protein